jgi:ABC-type glycerol-3-phosphate transport system substrate-binding protein
MCKGVAGLPAKGLGLLCVLLLLAGCGDLSLLSPKEPVTVRFAYAGDAGFYGPLVDAFQREHRNITVELVAPNAVGFGQFAELDVLVVPQFALNFLMDAGYPIELSTFMTEDADFRLEDFYATGVDLLSTGGQRWAVPYMADVMVMVYNKDLFDKYEVAYPDADWTWDGFLDRALSLTDPTEGVFGYATHQSGQLSMYEPMIFMVQWGGRLFDDLDEPTTMTINDPNNVAAMQWYADLIHRHGVAPGPGERVAPHPQSGIEDGRYAMWMGWLSDVEDTAGLSARGFDLGVAPIPRGQVPSTIGTVYGIVISSQTPDPNAAWEWVSFISRNPPPALVPLRHSLTEADAVAGRLDAEVIEVGRVSVPVMIGMNLGPEAPLWDRWGMAMQAFNGALAAIQNGEPVGPALDAAQKKVDF